MICHSVISFGLLTEIFLVSGHLRTLQPQGRDKDKRENMASILQKKKKKKNFITEFDKENITPDILGKMSL